MWITDYISSCDKLIFFSCFPVFFLLSFPVDSSFDFKQSFIPEVMLLFFPLQVDVIESQWNILQNHIQDSHDFTELVGFHQE